MAYGTEFIDQSTRRRINQTRYKEIKEALKLKKQGSKRYATYKLICEKKDVGYTSLKAIEASRSLKQYRENRRVQSKPNFYTKNSSNGGQAI